MSRDSVEGTVRTKGRVSLAELAMPVPTPLKQLKIKKNQLYI